ncbi:MAG: hypothetical protein H6Q59_1905 [Firmicutes bacterium]|nr:hypothetical protein [Bacillota bacterium]
MNAGRQFNNKGYTLIELVVTILITSMVAAIIVVFISASRASYDEVKKEAVLQEEAQMAGSYIGDIAIEASECTFTPFVKDGKNYKVLTIKAPDPEYVSGTLDNYYFIILWEQSTQTLRFCRVKDDAVPQSDGSYLVPSGSPLEFIAGTGTLDYATMLSSGGLDIIGNPRALLARYVTDMEVVVPNTSTGTKLTKINLKLKYRDREYILSKNITGRNLN